MTVSGVIRRLLGGDCCGRNAEVWDTLPQILIVGSPNVGKSVIFNGLTGRYVTVSNYPGTTVEVSRGRAKASAGTYEVVDTPGMYSLAPITDEERVACTLLTEGEAHAVVHVVDAKNIERMLGLTLQLIEAGLPVVLALNMADEARDLGIRVDTAKLEERLGVPVVDTVATTGEGMDELARRISEVRPAQRRAVDYGPELEPAVAALAHRLGESEDGPVSSRTRGLLLLQEVSGTVEWVSREKGPVEAQHLLREASESRGRLAHSAHYYAALNLKRHVEEVLEGVVSYPTRNAYGFREKLSRLTMNPLAGLPLLVLVLYFGLYKFVGVFGAGTLVDFLESTVFGKHINPWVEKVFSAMIPWQALYSLFAGEYGIITLGVRYAVAIILPIVGTFFIAFSILEDSGYLPRLAMLIDRVFKKIGLNGRAVIPMVLGFGCDTMAVMVTRTLETRRERMIAAILLALTIPCSAQLGVILALLSGHPYGLLVWALFLLGVFLLTGVLAARVMPGRGPSFYMELPPLRLPRLGNVVVKTYSRMVWYFKEVVPLFIVASVFIWVGQITKLFDLMVRGLEPLVRLIGLPSESAVAFLFGFFRRDYGAAGLYDLQKGAGLTGNQLVVAAITLTLFVPCIAQTLMLKKERGWAVALATTAGVFVIAFLGGFVAHALFTLLGVQL